MTEQSKPILSLKHIPLFKRIAIYCTHAFSKELLFVLLIFPAVVIAGFDSNEDIGILGGLAREAFSNEINYLALSKWLLIVSVPVLTHSVLLTVLRKNVYCIYLRVRNHRILWEGVLAMQIVVSFLYTVYLFSIKFICVNTTSALLMKAFAPFILHLIFLLSIVSVLFVYIPEHSNYSPVICLLFETISFSLYQSGIPCWYLLPGTWGMFYQSSLYSGGGFPVSVIFILESLIVVAQLIFVPRYKNLCN